MKCTTTLMLLLIAPSCFADESLQDKINDIRRIQKQNVRLMQQLIRPNQLQPQGVVPIQSQPILVDGNPVPVPATIPQQAVPTQPVQPQLQAEQPTEAALHIEVILVAGNVHIPVTRIKSRNLLDLDLPSIPGTSWRVTITGSHP